MKKLIFFFAVLLVPLVLHSQEEYDSYDFIPGGGGVLGKNMMLLMVPVIQFTEQTL